MAGFLSLSSHGFTTTVLITGGGVTPAEGARCPGEVPTTAMVTTPAEVVDGSVPAVSAEPPPGTSSPANAVPTTFRCLGREKKKKDCNIDKVSIQQPQDLTIPQDDGPIPGGFNTRELLDGLKIGSMGFTLTTAGLNNQRPDTGLLFQS
jgi:hypothetical protein